MPIDGGPGTATVTLDRNDAKILDKFAARTLSGPDNDPVTGVDLGAGPGAGRTSDHDFGGALDISTAPEFAEANARD